MQKEKGENKYRSSVNGSTSVSKTEGEGSNPSACANKHFSNKPWAVAKSGKGTRLIREDAKVQILPAQPYLSKLKKS